MIADITGNRPNVMYELGLAHASDKPVIILCRHGESIDKDVPFDIKTESILRYRSEADLEPRLRDAIAIMLGI